MARLQAGDIATAKFVGIPLTLFATRSTDPIDAGTMNILHVLVNNAALTAAINDAWAMIALLTVGAVICIPFARACRLLRQDCTETRCSAVREM